MSPGFLISRPGFQSFLFKAFSCFLAFNILTYRFAHDLVCRTMTPIHQMLNSIFQVFVEFD